MSILLQCSGNVCIDNLTTGAFPSERKRFGVKIDFSEPKEEPENLVKAFQYLWSLNGATLEDTTLDEDLF